MFLLFFNVLIDKNEQLKIEDIQNIVESDEEAQVETNQEDVLAEEDDTTKPMMTRRGRIIKMPARFLLITLIGIPFQTGSSTNDASNITMTNRNITECFEMEEMLYGLLIFFTPFMFIIIMMILFFIINGIMSFFTKQHYIASFPRLFTKPNPAARARSSTQNYSH